MYVHIVTRYSTLSVFLIEDAREGNYHISPTRHIAPPILFETVPTAALLQRLRDKAAFVLTAFVGNSTKGFNFILRWVHIL